MDRWDLLKWRKTLRYTQAAVAQQLGVNRGTIQHWENGTSRIPPAVDLACKELTRRWKQRPGFGPVTLVYGDGSLWQQPGDLHRVVRLQCESYPDNEAAIARAYQLKESPHFISPLIMEEDGGIVWSSPELLRELAKRRGSTIG